MKQLILPLLALLLCNNTQAQFDPYAEPPYGLEKIRALMNATKKASLSDEAYKSLSLREKFTYNMIYYESFYQNCSIYFAAPKGKIPAQLPHLSEVSAWSDRQKKFFTDNKDSVIRLIRIDNQLDHELRLNDKIVILLIDATEMIPFLQDCYHKKQDLEILTVLMQLMNDRQYAPFIESDLHKKLYTGYSQTNTIDYSKTDETFILTQATNFYYGLCK